MKVIIHDLPEKDRIPQSADVRVIHADGRYAPCQGCFKCWTKHPASCELKDSLHEVCRVIGLADDLVIITENWYGGYSPKVKNVLDRSIGTSTPFSTYRGGQMHHTLRYGKHGTIRVIAYGDMTEAEEKTWQLMTERNAVNEGFEKHEFSHVPSAEKLEGIEI